MHFKDLNLVAPLLQALATEGYQTPTPIQAKAIPIILHKKDIIGCAQTGTGKTAAFSLPILQLLSGQPGSKQIKCLVLTPTRELAIQVGESFQTYGSNLSLRTAVIFGGVPQGSQVKALQAGVDILVATPGRLLDLMQQKLISLQHISIFVLDEADRMLDMGFVHDVKRIAAVLPRQRQTLLFSATMPQEIKQLANTLLYQPETVEVTPVSSTAETVTQEVYMVDKGNKKNLLVHLMREKRIESVIVFTRTKRGADRLSKALHQSNIRAEAIHGDKTQSARQRALANFKNYKTSVLVATDIAARGIDIDDLPYVINYDLPEVAETYVHRIGRTGRAGATGIALSFCDAEEQDYLKDIQKLIGRRAVVVDNHPFHADDSKVIIRLPRNKQVVKRKNAVIVNR
jgi:ATP-dependent RNA helicase RhlE